VERLRTRYVAAAQMHLIERVVSLGSQFLRRERNTEILNCSEADCGDYLASIGAKSESSAGQ